MGKTKIADFVYLAVGLGATWWMSEHERGNKPAIQVLWTMRKMVLSTQKHLLRFDRVLADAIDKELDA